MPRPATDKRERLTRAATTLALTQGLDATSLGDIASEAGVPTGSVYYYFKTKDDVASAVVAEVAAQESAKRDGWDDLGDPRARLVAYIRSHLDELPDLRKRGSAAGAVVARLALTTEAPVGSDLIEALLAWLADQFAQLGFAPAAARARALHLATGMEGAAALAHALDDDEPVIHEAAHLERWVASTGA